MEINIYKVVPNNNQARDAHLELVALMPFKSVVWEEQYSTCGTMQAVFFRDEDTLDIIKVGRLATFTPSQILMYIHSVKITDTEVWAYGYEAKALFEKKVFFNTISATSTDIVQYLTAQIDSYRLNWMDSLIAASMGSENLTAIESNNWLAFIKSCCALNNHGFYLSLNPSTQTGRLTIKKPVSNVAILASQLGNVRDIAYTLTDKPYYNTVAIFGLTTDGVIAPAIVRDSGLTINDEIYSTLLDLRQDYPQPEGMSYDDYDAAIQTRGRISLGLRKAKETVDVGAIEQDCDWGDLVTVVIPELNVSAAKRIVSTTYKCEGGILTKSYKLGEV